MAEQKEQKEIDIAIDREQNPWLCETIYKFLV